MNVTVGPFNLTPIRRELAYAAAHLALLAARDPRRRWQLKHRIARIEYRRLHAGARR